MKYLCLIVAIMVVLCCFAGCAPSDAPIDVPYMDLPYETVLVGSVNDNSPVPLMGEPIWSGSSFQNDTAAREMTVTLFGESYTGSYDSSRNELWTSFVADYYECENGFSFAVESGTTRLVYLFAHAAYAPESALLPDVENAQEYALELAKERAAQLIEIEKYDIVLKTEPATVTIGDVQYEYCYYHVMLAKKVNGFSSMEYVSFKISSKGMVATYTAGERPGTFDTCNNVDCNVETINISTDYTMRKAGAPLSYYCREITYKDQKYVLTPTGEHGVYSKVSVEWEHSKSGEINIGNGNTFTKFGEKAVK